MALSYEEYIRSPGWAALRLTAIERDGGRCRLCNVDQPLTVHHRVYPERWEDDCLDHLTTLCRRCHRLAEEGSRAERYKTRPISAGIVAADVRGRIATAPAAVTAAPTDFRRVK